MADLNLIIKNLKLEQIKDVQEINRLDSKLDAANEELESLKKTIRNMESTINVSEDEFKELAAFVMCNDDPDQDAQMDVVNNHLNKIACECLGYRDWLQAYHEI